MPKKRTHEEFTELLKEATNGEYQALEKYVNNKTKIIFLHVPCGEKSLERPQDFFNDGVKCEICFVKKQGEKFKKYIEEFYNGEYKVVGNYVDVETRIKIKHIRCGNVIEHPPKYFFLEEKPYCTVCSQKEIKEKKHQNFLQIVREKLGNEYVVLGKLETFSKKVLLKHLSCGKEYPVLPKDVKSKGIKCPRCAGSGKKILEEFKEDVEKEVGKEYLVIGKKYIDNKTKIEIHHKKCGYKYPVRPDIFLNGKGRCPICTPGARLTHEEYLIRFNKRSQGEYELLTAYRNAEELVCIYHKKCNETYWAKPYRFTAQIRSGCPHCKESKGERRVRTYLKKHKIKFEPQFKFDDCKNVHPLPFDFAVFDENDKLLTLIEYDGKQHTKPYKYFGGMSSFLETKKKDKIRNEYCKKNGIPLLRINYTDFHRIEEILDKTCEELNISVPLH